MDTVLQDLRYAVRTLLQNPGFIATAIITLALGIGANTAMFSVVNALLIKPLPYADADRIVRIYDVNQERGVAHGEFSPQDFADLKRESRIFEHLSAFNFVPGLTGKNLSGIGEPRQLSTAFVSGDFFPTLGARAALGRTLQPSDDAVGNDHSLVLSDGFWRSQMGSDPSIIGRLVSVGDQPFTVVGVMPPDYQFPSPAAQAWAPLSLVTDDDVPHRRGIRWLSVVGKLRPDKTAAEAQAQVSLFLKGLENQFGDTNAGWGNAAVISLQESLVGGVRPVLLILLAAVAFVLVIACANIANLLLARGNSRGRELAIRTALGANRKRLVRQLMTESLLLAICGAAIGLFVARWGVRLAYLWSSGTILQSHPITIDSHVIAFCVLASLLTWPVFGLVPALTIPGASLYNSLKEGGLGSGSGRAKSAWREKLVIAEIALAVVLVVSSGLALKSFWRLIHVDPGFTSQHVLSLRVTIPESKTSDPVRFDAYKKEIFDRLAALPGVVAVGGSKTLPLYGGGEPYSFSVDAPAAAKVQPRSGAHIVTPGYFRALAIPLVAGRTFSDSDSKSVPTLVINQALARKHWPGQDPVGRKVYFGKTALEVIGVVGDVRNEGMAQAPEAAMYVPAHFFPRSRLNLFIRSTGNPLALAGAVRQAIWSVDKNQPIDDIASLDSVVSSNVAQPRFFAVLLATFGALALLLAGVGTYGVIAYTVRQQTQEFGVRMALGAQRRDVLFSVLKRSLRLAAIGLGIGIVAALAGTRILSSLLFGVSPTDPATFVGTAAVLGLVALLASYLPARWATRVDPMVALRYE